MPESGGPPEIIEDDNTSDYAFVGDITDVSLLIFSFHISNKQPSISPDHFNRKRKHPSQSIYNCIWNHWRIWFRQPDFYINSFSIHQSTSHRPGLPYLLFHWFWFEKMEDQKTSTHHRNYHIRRRHVNQNQTRRQSKTDLWNWTW